MVAIILVFLLHCFSTVLIRKAGVKEKIKELHHHLIEEEKIEGLSGGIPVISEDQVQSVCDYFQGKVDTLVQRFLDTPN